MPGKMDDRLRNGPCSAIYKKLEECAETKRGDEEIMTHKEKFMACPTSTDMLIKYMNKNPKHFFI